MLVLKSFGLIILLVSIGYLLGNILFGSLCAKFKKVDLRSQGSGNIGATNTSRILGPTMGVLVLICDIFKGWLAVLLASITYQTLGNIIFENDNTIYQTMGIIIYIGGLFAIIGHCFPFFYIYMLLKTKWDLNKAKKMSGGKGAATTAGVFMGISPWIFLIAFLIFIIIFFVFRYVSLASIVAISTVCVFTLIPRLNYFYMLNIFEIHPVLEVPKVEEAYKIDEIISYKNNWSYILGMFIIANIIGLLITFKHKDNIKRLLNGSEKHLFEWKKNNQ